ncbi:MAG: peptide ABC transporter substrate-binding protein, partial [Alphaproteobacteria bacterium]|nr:peptide ABC transporter substrate-binding protein [Alphaproteobacteria bacterium]
MTIRRIIATTVLATALSTGIAQAEKDELVIGISQFPQGFHPNITSHVALSLIHGMTRRPFTVYD